MAVMLTDDFTKKTVIVEVSHADAETNAQFYLQIWSLKQHPLA
jgi:hypothetical protein